MQPNLADPQHVALWQRIKALDLEPIKYKLVRENLWPASLADAVGERYRAFLFVVGAFPDRVHVPTRLTDEMWHVHILDTFKYAEDCAAVFGRFLHHFPYLGTRGEDDEVLLEQEFGRSKELLKEVFGGAVLVLPEGITDGAGGASACGNRSECKGRTRPGRAELLALGR